MSKIGQIKKLSNASKVSLMEKVMGKELESEIKRLELAKRQYEAFFTSEKRKLITRFAHRLMVSSSHDLAIKLEKLHKDAEEEENKKKKLVLPAIVPVQNKLDSSMSDSYYSFTESEQSSRMASPVIEQIYEEPIVKVKKNVMFSNDVIEREIPTKDNESDYLYHDYDPSSASNQNIIMAKVALVKRDRTLLPAIEEAKKPSVKSTKEFLDSLENENSGFYICTNSKGQPLCDGYDNYGLLLKSNQKRIEEIPEATTFSNPFETVASTPATPNLKRTTSNASHLISSRSNSNMRKSAGSRPSDTSALPMNKNKSKIHHVTSFNETKMRHNSAYLFKQILLVKRKEEEEKICNLQLKAQNIRSLTLKPINIY